MVMQMYQSRPELTIEQIRERAPSVFATRPKGDVSHRYHFIPTYLVLERMKEYGFRCVHASQAMDRVTLADNVKESYARHYLRFQHESFPRPTEVGDVVPELIMRNSHNRTATYSFYAGFFRLICTNGCVVSDTEFEGIQIRHIGEAALINQVVANSRMAAMSFSKIVDKVNKWSNIRLEYLQRLDLARVIAKSGWTSTDVPAEELYTPRRTADSRADLWTTFNVIQENITRGGFKTTLANGQRRRFPGIHNANSDFNTNRSIWSATEQFVNDNNLLEQLVRDV